MQPFSLKFAFDVCNALVWVAFVYLGWRAALIVFESCVRRRKLRTLAREICGLRQQADVFLKPCSKDATLTKRECQAAVLKDARYFWDRVKTPELAKLLPSMLEAILFGRDDGAADLVDRFLSDRDGRTNTEIQFKDRCLQNGLLGTVLGILGPFATGGNKIELSDLGFALGTTAVGLVLASVIELSLSLIFEPAWYDLRDELEESRSHWSRQWRERTQLLSDDTPEFLATAKVVQEVRSLRKEFEGMSAALRDVFAAFPNQLAKELATFAESPLPSFDDSTTDTVSLNDFISLKTGAEVEIPPRATRRNR